MRPGWVRTYTGIYVSLASPKPEMIELRDIAHQLSLECRWGGATERHYGVAEHSIWVARFTRELVTEEHRDAATIHALLHDAHEAYIKDIPTPLKVLLGDGYRRMADSLDQAIRAKFRLPEPAQCVKEAIKVADAYASWAEAQALLVPCAAIQKVGQEPSLELQAKVPMASEVKRSISASASEQAFYGYVQFAMKRHLIS